MSIREELAYQAIRLAYISSTLAIISLVATFLVWYLNRKKKLPAKLADGDWEDPEPRWDCKLCKTANIPAYKSECDGCGKPRLEEGDLIVYSGSRPFKI